MGIRTTAGRGATVAIGILAAATLAIGASPASAKVSDGFVRGYDEFRGDWSDEGIISAAERPNSNAVCLWQTVLWATGAIESDGTKFDASDIDGFFGPNTTYATKRVQVSWGLADKFSEADGRVGGNTFGKADDWLVKGGGSIERGKTLYLTFNSGGPHRFDLYRSSVGIYNFKIGQSDGAIWRQASYSQYGNSCD